jgi:ribose transport system substrate-binding protein
MPNRKLGAGDGSRRAARFSLALALGLGAATSSAGCEKLQQLTGLGGGGGATAAPEPRRAPVTDGTGPKIVPGPGTLPQCFAPWAPDTKYFQWPARKPPFRLALVNGYVGNAWRIQMVKTAKAFAKDPAIAPLVSEFKVVSTGTNMAAQLAAIEDFINQGFDGIVTLAVNPQGFDRVITLANKRDVVIVPFDNVLDTDRVMQVNEDQTAMGRQWGVFLDKLLKGKGKVLEVRGLQGNSTERDRHDGFRQVMGARGKKYQFVEVVGSWDDARAQKAVAEALAAHHTFDAMMVQGGSTGAIRALLEGGHKPIPVATEAENGARKLIAKNADKGMKGLSLGDSPGLAAIAMKAALEALQGKVMPQKISVPIPAADDTTLEDGHNYYSKLSDNFFTPNEFRPCGVNLSSVEIMNESESDVK